MRRSDDSAGGIARDEAAHHLRTHSAHTRLVQRPFERVLRAPGGTGGQGHCPAPPRSPHLAGDTRDEPHHQRPLPPRSTGPIRRKRRRQRSKGLKTARFGWASVSRQPPRMGVLESAPKHEPAEACRATGRIDEADRKCDTHGRVWRSSQTKRQITEKFYREDNLTLMEKYGAEA